MAAFIMASRVGSAGAAMTVVRLRYCCFQDVLLGRGISEDYLLAFQRLSIVPGTEVSFLGRWDILNCGSEEIQGQGNLMLTLSAGLKRKEDRK